MLSKTNKRKNKNFNEKNSADIQREKARVREESAASENMPIVFSWSTADFIRKPLTEFYFIAGTIGSMVMIGWGIYNRNFIMVVTFMMLVILIILVLNDEPKKVDVVISEKGVDLNGQHYNYNEFKSYKISFMDEMPVLTLKGRNTFSLFKTIYLENEPVNDLESFLGLFLAREDETTGE